MALSIVITNVNIGCHGFAFSVWWCDAWVVSDMAGALGHIYKIRIENNDLRGYGRWGGTCLVERAGTVKDCTLPEQPPRQNDLAYSEEQDWGIKEMYKMIQTSVGQ